MIYDPEVAKLVEEIRQDRMHGASWLSLRAIGALRLAASNSPAGTIRDFLSEMKFIARDLAEARPPMAPIANLVALWFHEIEQAATTRDSLDSLRSFAILAGEKIIKACRGAFNRVVEHGSQIVDINDVLISCSDSTTILESLKSAKVSGKEFRALIAESQSIDGRTYGKAMAEKMKAEGIPTEVIPDDVATVMGYMPEATKVMVGADSILDDGSLINGSPTLTLAKAAKERQIPFYVVCETTKINALRLVGRHLWIEEGFEVIPANMITRIVTEEGIMTTAQTLAKAEHMAKYLRTLWE